MRWYPANEEHAIERVAFTALLDFPLAPKGFQSILAKIGQKASLVGINEMVVLPPPLQIQLSPQDAAVGVFSPSQRLDISSAGRSYRKTENGTIAEEIIYNPTALVFAATKYKRWSPFLDRLSECLSEALTEIAENTNIIDIRLEYWDRFDLRSEQSSQTGTTKLINESTKLISPYFTERVGSWHAHVGFFQPDGMETRTLVNANVDVISNTPGLPPIFPEGTEAQARIYTLASAQHIVLNKGFPDWENIKANLSAKHQLLKSLLCDLIDGGLSDLISLKAEPLDQ
jgi:uncharacterized protein (TIGR04255 family)